MTVLPEPGDPVTRRQFIKAAGITAQGQLYQKPSIESLSARSALDHYHGRTTDGSHNPAPGGGTGGGGGGNRDDWWWAWWRWLRGRR